MNDIRYMIRTKLRRIAIFALAGAAALSCTQEDTGGDPRDEAIGPYAYSMKVYEMTAAGLLHMNDADLTGVFELTKGSSNTTVEAKEGAFTTFTGENIQRVANGFSFTLRDQVGSASGTEIILSGYEGIRHEGRQYQGLYLAAPRSITVNLIFTRNRQDFLVVVSGTRR